MTSVPCTPPPPPPPRLSQSPALTQPALPVFLSLVDQILDLLTEAEWDKLQDDVEGAGLFSVQAVLNHSCEPNCEARKQVRFVWNLRNCAWMVSITNAILARTEGGERLGYLPRLQCGCPSFRFKLELTVFQFSIYFLFPPTHPGW